MTREELFKIYNGKEFEELGQQGRKANKQFYKQLYTLYNEHNIQGISVYNKKGIELDLLNVCAFGTLVHVIHRPENEFQLFSRGTSIFIKIPEWLTFNITGNNFEISNKTIEDKAAIQVALGMDRYKYYKIHETQGIGVYIKINNHIRIVDGHKTYKGKALCYYITPEEYVKTSYTAIQHYI
jgi:hypothetical protein